MASLEDYFYFFYIRFHQSVHGGDLESTRVSVKKMMNKAVGYFFFLSIFNNSYVYLIIILFFFINLIISVVEERWRLLEGDQAREGHLSRV